MEFFTATSKAEFLQQLEAALSAQVDAPAQPSLARFAARFYAMVPLEELRLRRRADLLGCTLSAWRLLQGFVADQPQVRVYNPDYERNGWQSVHSVVEILHPDMPFLVDSVRIELKRQGLAIHTLQSSVLNLRRDAAGNLLEVLEAPAADASREALIYLETDRCAQAAALHALERALREVLDEVRLVVADFIPMRERLRDHCQRLASEAAGTSGEVREFLDWLLDDHFTFPGYEEVEVCEQAQGALIEYRQDSLLGLSRRLRSELGVEERRIDALALEYLREPLPLSLMPGPSGTESRCAPTTTTR